MVKTTGVKEMNYADMKMTDLRQAAKNMGITPEKHESKQQLLARIAYVLYPEQQKADVVVSKAQIESSPVFNGEQAVLDAVAPFMSKGIEFNVIDDGCSWIARFRGAEASGSMSMPIAAIKRTIELHVSKGARLPRIAKEGDFAGCMV